MFRLKVLNALLLPFLPLSVLVAQNTSTDKSLKFFNKTEAGISFGIGSFKTDIVMGTQKKIRNDEIVVTFQTINGVKYLNLISLGLSVGVEKWQKGLFWPIYGYLGVDLKPSDNTFFANAYFGYSIGTRYATTNYHQGSGGFAMSIGIGYKMKVAKKIKFIYEVFYKYQSIESSYTAQYDTIRAPREVAYKVPLHFAGFKLGICLP